MILETVDKARMKIMIVDDHPVFREGIAALFTHAAENCVVLQAETIAAASRLVSIHPDLDVVLLDLMMPGAGGLPAIAAFSGVRRDLPVVVLSSSEDVKDVRLALAAGALGYVPKSASPKVLMAAVELVISGEIYVPPLLLTDPETSTAVLARPGHVDLLTERQIAVLKLVADGMPTKTIAVTLGISEKTIKTHITSIFRALEVVNRTQAARVGRELGLL